MGPPTRCWDCPPVPPPAKPSSAGAPLHVLPSFQPGSVATFGPGPCHGFLGSQQLAPMDLQGQARHPLPSSFPGAQALLPALGAVALPALPQAPHVPLSCSGPAPSKDAAFPAFGTNTAVLAFQAGCSSSRQSCPLLKDAPATVLSSVVRPGVLPWLMKCLHSWDVCLATWPSPVESPFHPQTCAWLTPHSEPPFPAHLQGLGSSVGGMSERASAVLGLCCCLAPHITTRWMAAPLGWPPKSQQSHLSSFKCS